VLPWWMRPRLGIWTDLWPHPLHTC